MCHLQFLFRLIFQFFSFVFHIMTGKTFLLYLIFLLFTLSLFAWSGAAGPAEYKCDPAGQEPDSYLLEWTVVSYTPITAFRIETREAGTTAWKESTSVPIEDGPYHYAGKLFLKQLSYATRYEAKVQARNDEGWSKTREIFNFATQGAGGCLILLFFIIF